MCTHCNRTKDNSLQDIDRGILAKKIRFMEQHRHLSPQFLVLGHKAYEALCISLSEVVRTFADMIVICDTRLQDDCHISILDYPDTSYLIRAVKRAEKKMAAVR